MLATTLIVITIAQPSTTSCEPGACGGEAMTMAFEDAVRRVLGRETAIRSEIAGADPADEDTAARASSTDGAVELSFAASGDRAHLHCYLTHERRWLDREIGFGERRASLRTEITERGRLLGFAVATMFGGSPEPEPAEPPPAPPTPPPATKPASPVSPSDSAPSVAAPGHPNRSIEFAGVASLGIDGPAGALGASAGLRLRATGPLWVRGFIGGRAGNVPAAQATTRTALVGSGLALDFLPESSRLELGARLDAFVSYFDATHLSEDDVAPDRRSRWLPGAALLTELGARITDGTSLVAGVGIEGMLGKTDIYTHGHRVAVIPPFRVLAEVGFRSHF